MELAWWPVLLFYGLRQRVGDILFCANNVYKVSLLWLADTNFLLHGTNVTSKKTYFLRSAGLLLLTGAVGATITLLTARWLLLSAARVRLSAYAAELLRVDEQLAANITDTLSAASRTADQPCSPADFTNLRALLFRSKFLKDIGRLKNGVLYCSAVGGVFPNPIPSDPPNLITDGGRKVYFQHELVVTKGYRAQVIATDDASVVVSPDVFSEHSRAPLHYAGYIRSLRNQKKLFTYNNFPADRTVDEIPLNQYTRQKGSLLYSTCSSIRPDCVVVGVAVADVMQPNNRDLLGSAIAGALVGGSFCAVILILSHRRQSMAWRLRRAIRKKRLQVFYQPIVDLHSSRIVSAEALVRWTDDDGMPMRPELFVALAEDRGFIQEITQFVLGRAVEDLKAMLRISPEFHLTVNLSARDLMDPTFPATVEAVLAAQGICAVSLGFELTERSTANLSEVRLAIRELRRRGHSILIDDFGTGYSSLAYLNDLSVDVVKVDRAFTRTIGTGSLMESIVPQILAMADGLHLKVVIEGVEHPDQLDYLTGIMPGLMGQGWLFGQPMPVTEFLARLEDELPGPPDVPSHDYGGIPVA